MSALMGNPTPAPLFHSEKPTARASITIQQAIETGRSSSEPGERIPPSTQPYPSIAEPQPSALKTASVQAQCSTIVVQGITLTALPKAAPDGHMNKTSAPALGAELSSTMFPAGHSPGPNVIHIGGTILSPGGPDVTQNNFMVSLDSQSNLVVGTSTTNIAGVLSPSDTPNGDPVHKIVSPDISVPDLQPGRPSISIGGYTVSLWSSLLVVGSKTITFDPANALSGSRSASAIRSMVTSELARESEAAAAKVMRTMSPGAPAITIHGQIVSLGSSAIVVGSVTQTYDPSIVTPTAASGNSIGSMIFSALGGCRGDNTEILTAGRTTPTTVAGNQSASQSGQIQVGIATRNTRRGSTIILVGTVLAAILTQQLYYLGWVYGNEFILHDKLVHRYNDEA